MLKHCRALSASGEHTEMEKDCSTTSILLCPGRGSSVNTQLHRPGVGHHTHEGLGRRVTTAGEITGTHSQRYSQKRSFLDPEHRQLETSRVMQWEKFIYLYCIFILIG